jgi:hypothetical protein
MKWNKEHKNYLKSFIDSIEDDNLKLKHEVKEMLLDPDWPYICYLLFNKAQVNDNGTIVGFEDLQPDDFFGRYILPYYMIHPTQTEIQNYLCYETRSSEVNRYNSAVKEQQLIFYILCQQKSKDAWLTGEDNAIYSLGMARHDLLAAMIKNRFNYHHFSCGLMQCVSDVPSVIDNDWNVRTLIFECATDANLVKKFGKNYSLVNKLEVVE